VMKSFDTGQVLRTWNSGSYKVGGTLEEIFLLGWYGPCHVHEITVFI